MKSYYNNNIIITSLNNYNIAQVPQLDPPYFAKGINVNSPYNNAISL